LVSLQWWELGAGLHVMDFDQFLNWLEGTPIAVAIREHEVLFPWIESLHVLAIALVVGTISIVDLRLIGLASRNRAVTILMREVLPYTWFSSNAPKYAHNFYFQAKMALLVLAGCNMAAFHRIAHARSRAGTRREGRRSRPRPRVASRFWFGSRWWCAAAGSASHCTSAATGVFFGERSASQSREGRPMRSRLLAIFVVLASTAAAGAQNTPK